MTGGTDKIVRVYDCMPGPPSLMAEVQGHMVRQGGREGGRELGKVSQKRKRSKLFSPLKDRIMTVQFCNTRDR